MPETSDVTGSGPSSKPPENTQTQVPATDPSGVPWMNRAKELERKYGDLEAKLLTVTQKLSEAVQKGYLPTGVPNEEEMRRQRIAQLAENPDGFIEAKVEERLLQSEALDAMVWLRSQEGWKPEYEPELSRIMREEGLSSRPMRKAQTAWKLLKQEHPDFTAKEAEARERELRKYQVEGPGSRIFEPPTKEEEELRKQFANPKLSMRDRADVLNKLSTLRLEREAKQQR